jgi:hypothetical protein
MGILKANSGEIVITIVEALKEKYKDNTWERFAKLPGTI